ncbi:MAG: magnesium/cobalt transporter CorA [Bacteroidota bacterium]|nr:magnesium/cobalt transporter CorA [Bacteroidota bacterium]
MKRLTHCVIDTTKLIYNGERKIHEPNVTLIAFNNEVIENYKISNMQEFNPRDFRGKKLWINIDGLHDSELIQNTAEKFKLHPMIIENLANVHQRPTAEIYGTQCHIIMKMLNFDVKQETFQHEQLSIIFSDNWLITFQEEPGDVFDSIRHRMSLKSRIRLNKIDYLAYALMDMITDTYFRSMDIVSDWLEALENSIMSTTTNHKQTVQEINDLKHDLSKLRRFIWPVRDIVNQLTREDEDLISKETSKHLRELYNTLAQLIDNLELYRENLSNMLDLYLSNLSYKMNDIMKTLTVITTIFIPLTFITSIYGMNFVNLPEIHTKYGYFVVMGLMLMVMMLMIRYFRKKRWI